ncbi:MAG TPA: glutamate--tRNA ligase [Vicinamibacterales bacterium]|nr:glutamate--tRNA ligase [Vicinamibacterales bacterium]
MATRVRFAPSPTGYLHVGGARTALFNWLHARQTGGTFILRIEDTDAERSSREMVQGILDGLRWLGLDWDEGPEVGGPHEPYFQSQRLERYRELARELLSSGRAYRCFCAPDEIKVRRERAEAAGGGWKYDRLCASLPQAEAQARVDAGEPHALRFMVPSGTTGFDDTVHGRIEFANTDIEDFVVLRSDGYPTYHLSVVADDVDMQVSHIVRGDDHISNTPKHVLIFEALGRPVPAFAHVPLILGTDKKRLSKRHGATSVMEYARQGILPEALFNFLALLGWSPGNDREIFDKGDLIEAFSLGGISGGNAVFNPEKLEWFNQQHMQRLPDEEIARRIEPLLRERGLWRDGFDGAERPWLLSLIELLKPRAKRLHDFADETPYLFNEDVVFDEAAVAKHLGAADARATLAALAERLSSTEPFDRQTLDSVVRAFATERGVKVGAVVHPARVALTGRSVSPGLFEVMELLGRDRTVLRLSSAATPS